MNTSPSSQALSQSREKIIIIDDEMVSRTLHTQLLASDYEVSTACDGVEGLDLIRKIRPDLVLADNIMPHKSGIELLHDIRSDPELHDIPVIILSALTEASHKIQGLNAGADDYLPKPFDLHELKIRISGLLLKKRYERELAEKNCLLEEALEKQQATLCELKEAHAQLVHSSKLAAIGQLSAGIAHEVNNPALSISNALEILERDLTRINSGEISIENQLVIMMHFIGLARSSVARIRHVVDSLSKFSRKNREGVGTVDITDGIDSTLDILNHQFGDAICIHRKYLAHDPIEADLQQLNQVFMNLILNAVHAIQEKQQQGQPGGNIWITTKVQDDSILISVRDDGIGIPKTIQDRIFEPFFTTKDVGSGSGLGLDISYRIIKAHQGEIHCESKEQVGTTFTITLPRKTLTRDQDDLCATHEEDINDLRRETS